MKQSEGISAAHDDDSGIIPGEVCPMPAKGAMGSAVATIIL